MGTNKMKAVVYEKYGPPDVLHLTEVDKPIARAKEVLVRNHAASLNYGDMAMVRGKPYLSRLWSGLVKPKLRILGSDVAGTVEAVGESVERFQPGDEVYGGPGVEGFNTFAEYVSVAENALVLKPATISFKEAAAVPQAALIALQGLRNYKEIQPGQKVLINGATGGIGTFAVQIAKSFGAEVTGTCSTRNLELLRSLGADKVIDYTQEDFTEGLQRYDLILDIVANRPVSAYMRALTATGSYVAAAFNPLALFFGGLLSQKNGKQAHSLINKTNPEDLGFLRELQESGMLKSVIDRCFPISELAEAIKYLESGRHHGKVVITVNHDKN
jgi:NADPH:quinone reductase-like Zn-dependent oxidoreductase